jgi:putative FmdB family regulatory protein
VSRIERTTRLPTYEYRCDSCEKNFDVVQSFHDDPITSCPTCGSPVRKVFGNVGIVFKGSGFYKNDSRGGSGKAPAGDGASTESSGSESSSGEKATPAAAPSGDSSGAATKSDTNGASAGASSSAKPAPAKTSKKEPTT